MTPTGIYAPGTGGKGTGLHPVDTRDANNQNLSRESLIRYRPNPTTPPVTDQLEAHYAARLESFADGDAVGTLTDQQNTNDLTQATSSKKPTFRDNGTDNIGGRPIIDPDGSDDLLTLGGLIASTTTATLHFVATMQLNSAIIWSVGDTSGNTFSNIRVELNAANNEVVLSANDAGTLDQVTASVTASADEPHIITVRTDGTSYSIRFDGVDQTLTVNSGSNNGKWTADITDIDDEALFARHRDTDDGFWGGRFGEGLFYSKALTNTEMQDNEDWLNNTVGYGVF